MSATLTIYLLLYAFPSHFFHFVSFLAAVPRGGPHIQGYKVDVSLGDELQINCTSLYSKPAANLQFFINNKVSISSQFAFVAQHAALGVTPT